LMACNDAKEDGGSEVIGAKDFGTEGGHVIEDGGFTAAGVDGSEIEAWGLGESFNDMGMSGPEGEDNGSARREVKVEEGAVMDLVEESGRVEDGLGPGFDEGEADFFGFGVIIADAGGFDGVIECAETEAEAFGFGTADEVVVEGVEFGEASQDVGEWSVGAVGSGLMDCWISGWVRSGAVFIFDFRFLIFDLNTRNNGAGFVAHCVFRVGCWLRGRVGIGWRGRGRERGRERGGGKSSL